MFKYLALVACCAAVLAVPAALADESQPSTATAAPPASKPVCAEKCHLKRDYRKLRKATPREPIPTYITQCESGGNLHALNESGSGAGGRYQVMPSTWRANLPSARVVKIAEQLTRRAARRRMHRHHRLDRGPRWSGRLLQDVVASTIYREQGSSPWSCA